MKAVPGRFWARSAQ